ncbi:MFS transporter [Bacillus inaquosorum]|uniref:MFS transporter n=1 Tax=Bacillus inaquosorum TaxID=483913 RepID=A0A9Q4EU53_9BACI|nr:MFS transporter [Bacillus inaquosorum]MCY7786078.1 MFS transporter [Bacillus inaquosorum]MCY7818210.1 MFS transporter [Bacillus inaquosorum]MCY7936850.1 MFS transporter [Bacillus inaquosorum]MCY7977825.1 MFS transporter [Bacillus inaquosorum]MCY8082449.1 MFS transporter [Bacillus inaquosorum]
MQFLHNKNVFALLLSQSLQSLAGVLVTIVLMVRVYQMTDSVFLAGLVLSFMSFASIAASFCISPVLRNLGFKKVLVFANLLRAVFTILMAYSVSHHGQVFFWITLLFVFCFSFAGAFFQPARFALLPIIVPKEQYVKANGVISLSNQLFLTAGWGLGGLLTYVVPFELVVGAAICLFVLSGVSISLLHINEEETDEKAETASARSIWKDLMIIPVVRDITVMDMIEALAGSVWSSAILLAFTAAVLHETEVWWGMFNASYFIGAIVGSIIAIRFSVFFEQNMGYAIMFSSLVMSVLTLLFSFSPIPLLCALACAAMGPFYQVRDICQETVLQEAIPEQKRIGIMAAKNAILTPWSGITYSIMGLVADAAGAKMAFITAGVLYGMTFLIALAQPRLLHYKRESRAQ